MPIVDDIEWATHYIEDVSEKEKWKIGKSHNGNERKTIGSVQYNPDEIHS